jgi:hypothetical protein
MDHAEPLLDFSNMKPYGASDNINPWPSNPDKKRAWRAAALQALEIENEALLRTGT